MSRTAGVAGLLAVIAVAGVGCSPGRAAIGERTPASIPRDGPIVVALTGDTELRTPVREAGGTAGQPFDLLRTATLAFTNLETVLLDRERALEAEARPLPRWSFGPVTLAGPLRDLGFDLVSIANNHAMDFGAGGLASTTGALGSAGIRFAGAGSDLAAARAPIAVGEGSRRVALIAVTTSARPESGASPSQPDIRGRPGVNLLGYAANITVDRATFQTLKQSVVELNAGPPPGDSELTMFGTRIARGEQTRVDFVMNDADERAILEVVRETRRQTEFVIVSLHSHEPSNASDEPADFIRRFAHDAVDAGARVVVGHGPHRVRGAEIYKGAPIFYSLGNFIYDTGGLDFRAADSFDAGQDLFTSALGALGAAPPPLSQLEAGWWWEGLLVRMALEPGGRSILRIYPVDLGVDRAVGERGQPRRAAGERGGSILRRFSAIGDGRNPQFQQDDGGPFLEWSIP